MLEEKKKIGLALSGGGYRAAAYHIGTLRALNRLGILNKVDVISSVSGGSIIAAYYALNKDNYQKFEESFIKKLQKGVLTMAIVNALLVVAVVGVTLLLKGWIMILLLVILFFCQFKLLPFSFWIEKAYNRSFFKDATLSDLPSKPLIAMNSTDISSSGTLFTFSKVKMTGYMYEGGKIVFNHANFPVARAVMASSCVPFAFSPVKIPKKYFPSKGKMSRIPLLVDGGLYDNQGAHKLSEKRSIYHTQYNIVSNAGAGSIDSKWSLNTLLMLSKTASIMMSRIRTLQSRNNMFMGIKGEMRYTYLGLSWSTDDRLIKSFVDHIPKNNISDELCAYHYISESDIAELKSNDKSISEIARQRVIDHMKKSIGWEQLSKEAPTVEEHDIAKSVGTNLTGLSEKKIEALIKHSNWLTEVQVSLYMPELINPTRV